MVRFNFKNPKFVKSAVLPKDFPILRDPEGRLMAEVAVAGRSNVGKSSLLNDLFQSKDLVKTSSTPGKTQVLNFFTLDDRLAFVDLPGYGYAKVSQSVRKQWGPMVQNYLEQREPLKLLLFLIDIRRLPNEEEFQLLEWVHHSHKEVIFIFTKADKVNQSERHCNPRRIVEAFGDEPLDYIVYSTQKKLGRLALIRKIEEVVKK
jgi:GTP-binding protein